MNNILIVAVHPDDETLGCGGTILKHKSNGDKIYWLIITNISEEAGYDKTIVDKRQNEIKQVAKKYNFNKTYKLDFPTTKLDTIPTAELVNKIKAVVEEIQPNIVYLPFPHDVHSDHNAAFKAAYSCTKSFRFEYITEINLCETLSETDFSAPNINLGFNPNYFVDITPFLEKKLEIMSLFESEIMSLNYPRSLEALKALAKLRGCRIGSEYGEAFMNIYKKW